MDIIDFIYGYIYIYVCVYGYNWKLENGGVPIS